jgi:preprotein translocase subunit SecY
MTSDLAGRIAVTIGALLLFRLGSYIPLPGVNPEAWEILTWSQGGGVAAIFGASSGGAKRLAIFALGIIPYVSAAVLVQLATIFSSRLRARAGDGERGRAAMVRYARYLTALLTAFQAWGVADGLEHASGVVVAPGPLFIISTVLTLTGGTLFLAWLAEQITARGIGNGIALILLAGIVTDIPASIAYALEVMRQGSEIILVLLVVIVVTAVVVVMELARRRLPIQFAGRQAGSRTLDAQMSDLSLKLNPAGIVPVLLAAFVLTMLLSLASLLIGFDSVLVAQIRPGGPSRLIVWAVLIVLCTFFYTASVLDPEEAAERLKGLGGTIPDVSPGEETAAHLDRVVSRTTILGAAYLVLVMLLPEILIQFAHVPFYFGGTGLLVAVCTVIDLADELRVRSSAPVRP